MTKPLRISPKYNVEDWKQLDFVNDEDWQKGIDIFVDRIQNRFLKFIDQIKGKEFAGFAVLALDCLLIETLQQFREGMGDTPSRKGEEYFVRFLTETTFKAFFDKDKAKKFYDQFRNGILHQAELKKDSRVLKTGELVESNGDGLKINRDKFHEQLVKVFEEYVEELRSGASEELREKFRKKMNLICRV
jgi:hypothetical protein